MVTTCDAQPASKKEQRKQKRVANTKMTHGVIVIIGAGIAGLYVALKLSKRHKIILLDDRDYIGGRVHTHRHPQYEIGAKRFHSKHKMVNALVSKYALHKVPIGSTRDYLDADDVTYKKGSIEYFDDRLRYVLKSAQRYSDKYLQTLTFYALCEKVLPKEDDVEHLMSIFGYRCEFELQNAYDACRSFTEDFTGLQFFALSEGLSEICNCMAKEIVGNGGKILMQQKVQSVHRNKHGLIVVTDEQSTIICNNVVFAIKPHQMRPFTILRPVRKLLNSVRAGQLLRIYAKFPIRKNGPWFAGMKKTTTNSFLRQIIPISEKTGLIMLSYTDGTDVDFFIRGKRVRSDAQRVVMAECRRLFGQVPNPIYFKAHYWSEGTHYWKPHFDSNAVSERLVNPVANVFTCGEGFSQNQCWMEGALISARRVVSAIVETSQRC